MTVSVLAHSSEYATYGKWSPQRRPTEENSPADIPPFALRRESDDSTWIRPTRSTWNDLGTYVAALYQRNYFVLFVLGVFNALLTFLISKTAGSAWDASKYIYDTDSFPNIVSFFIILLIKFVYIVLAVYICYTFCPDAAGSGIPELRAILGGIWIKDYLSLKTGAIKIVSLLLVLASGLPIGLEGPFIHISAILARLATRIPAFQHLDRNSLLSAACAGGLASVFGSPIGGVLFSIEVTSTYYQVSNYWTAFICAAVGSTLTVMFTRLYPTSLLLFETRMPEEPYNDAELVFFALIGVATGLMGAGFVALHGVIVRWRRHHQAQWLGDNPYNVAIVIIFTYNLLTFLLGDFAFQPYREAIKDLFNTKVDSLRDCTKTTCEFEDWNRSNLLIFNLVCFVLVTYIFTALSVTLCVPCGIFAPMFMTGAGFGRLVGEIVTAELGADFVPTAAVYAVVAAAAMVAGVTRTISPAVIALELTKQINIAVPCLIAVICACGVSFHLSESFYDSILRLKQIPILPSYPSNPMKKNTHPPRPVIATDIMDSSYPILSTSPHPEHIYEALENETYHVFPIVHSMEEPVLVGEVSRSVLQDFIHVAREADITGHSCSLLDKQFVSRCNLSPIQVIAEMPLTSIYKLYHVLRPENVYVTKFGRLIGTLNEEMMFRDEERSRQQIRLSSCWRFFCCYENCERLQTTVEEVELLEDGANPI